MPMALCLGQYVCPGCALTKGAGEAHCRMSSGVDEHVRLGVQALLSFGATGVNVAPQGLNIAPALIAVTPGHVAVNPQGGTISPVGLSVTAPAEEPSQGRRMLRQSLFQGFAGAVTGLAAEAEAAASNLLGDAPAAVSAQSDAPPASGPAQPATQEVRTALCLLFMWY